MGLGQIISAIASVLLGGGTVYLSINGFIETALVYLVGMMIAVTVFSISGKD